MKKALAAALITLSLMGSAHAATVAPSFDLEKKIAYQQGQFGALYANCGSPQDQAAVIGGSLTTWRDETFEGYHGSAAERAALEKAFNEAAEAVSGDHASCSNWLQQASATWRSIATLSRYGIPTATKG
jgi:opacity protein-like surface antigen